MQMVCVGCGTQATLQESVTAVCERCGAPQRVAGRFVALQKPATRPDGLDEVEGAAPLMDGVEVGTNRSVLMRVAGPEQAARLEREATVLRGVSIVGVPKVLALEAVSGVGSVLVMEDVGIPLERALADGLRTDGQRVRALLRGALRVLVGLHGLSPPVFHRHIHSGTLCWDGHHAVGLRDFARATDTLDDHANDRVLPRAGFFPSSRDVGPVAVDLYGIGAVAVHVLSRRSPDTLALINGMPDFRAHVTVDEPLVQFLERLLSAGTRRAFATAQEALNALPGEPAPKRPATPLIPLVAGGLVVLLGAGAMVVALTMGHRVNAPNPPPVMVIHPPPVAPPPPQQPPKAPPVTPRTVDMVHVRVTSNPSGAIVTLNGASHGRTPLDVGVPASSRGDLVLTLEGYETAGRKLVLWDDVELHVDLVALKRAAPPPQQPQPPPQVIVPKLDDSWRKSVERTVAQQREVLVACGSDGVDRTRIKLGVLGSGKVDRAEPLGQANMASTTCVKNVLRALTLPSRGDASQISVDVWVYFRPEFRVAVY